MAGLGPSWKVGVTLGCDLAKVAWGRRNEAVVSYNANCVAWVT